MTNSPREFEQYQSGSLHEGGHAVLAFVLDRKLLELSIQNDELGDGYVCRERRENTPMEILEEIAIALAGEETPYLWGSGWATDAQHDRDRINYLARKGIVTVDESLVELIRGCVKKALPEFRDAIAEVAWALSKRTDRKMSGKEAVDIITAKSPNGKDLRECLARALSLA
jgi:hypothetical protein